ncbi:CAP domain-containing protein [Candidatus Roizmanbacteria bacterium]|nr:CAP domain-containing protein [Candidatus Roizmanbacteria bacterium]
MHAFKRLIYHFFIPHEGNNYKAKALHVDFLTYYLLFAIFITFGFKILITKTGDVLGFASDISIDKLYQLTNGVRLQNNLTTLEYNEKLTQAAQKKAADMLAKNYWSHYGPNGETPWDFLLTSGYQYEFAGENLAKNFLFSQGVIDAWMNSQTHKENILRKDYSQVGFAVVNGILNGEETTLVVQMFGKPFSTPLVKKPEIRPETVVAKTPELTQPIATATIVVNKPIAQTKPVILAQQKSAPVENRLVSLSFNSSLVFLLFLLVTLISDFYFAHKLRIIRVGSKNLAHIIFIGFIFLGLLLLTKGSIL